MTKKQRTQLVQDLNQLVLRLHHQAGCCRELASRNQPYMDSPEAFELAANEVARITAKATSPIVHSK